MFKRRFPKIEECPHCKKNTKFHRVSDRKCFACQNCAYQLHPLAGTIFHKSSTPLKMWFFGIFLFATSKNGVSAKELQRHLGVTYKTAWRMANQIRDLFKEERGRPLEGTVEVDETYVGGKARGKRGRGADKKTAVFGMLEREGIVRATVVINTRRSTVEPLIRANVKIGVNIMSDEYSVYGRLAERGYNHQTVQHGVKQYVRGDVHTNSIEGFWSQLKRSINGTYHNISKKYLQDYVDEFAWRYNRRSSPMPLFSSLIDLAAKLGQ